MESCDQPNHAAANFAVGPVAGPVVGPVAGQASPEEASDLSLEGEVDRLAHALAVKFEELTLIHQLSERMKLGEASNQICKSLLDELAPCIEGTVLAIELDADEEFQYAGELFVVGDEVDGEWLKRVAQYTSQAYAKSSAPSEEGVQVAIVNDPCDAAPAKIRSVVVSIQRKETNVGRMIALRSIEDEEFGTMEADLMKSTSMILAVHLINQRQFDEMQQMFEGTIQSLVSALDAKDAYTCGHSTRVAELAVELAQRLEYCEDGVARIRMAGILHDIGKIGVDDYVLRKPGKLTDEEFEQIKQHPVLGYEILRGIRPFRKILPAVRHHHESWDGTGYPDGLIGEAIPRDAQVLAVADAFDAMTSDRPYRNGMPIEKVMRIFEGGRGTQWAADVVDVLLSCPDVMQAHTNKEGRDVQNHVRPSDG
jgi:putative nucleotidyltransferase with HDIG domain